MKSKLLCIGRGWSVTEGASFGIGHGWFTQNLGGWNRGEGSGEGGGAGQMHCSDLEPWCVEHGPSLNQVCACVGVMLCCMCTDKCIYTMCLNMAGCGVYAHVCVEVG